MRIHLPTLEFPPDFGGVATWASAVANALREAGHEVTVYAGRTTSTQGTTRMYGRAWNRWGHLWVAAQIRPRLRDGDVVLCATWPLALFLVGKCRLAVAYHGSDITRPNALGSPAAVAKRAINLPVSNYLGSQLGSPFTVLPFPSRLEPAVRGGNKLLFVGRFTAQKGADRAMKLAERLGRDILLVGDGPERPRLVALSESLRVKAHFLGATREIPWAESCALALLSRPYPDGSGAEGLGLVLLEAAARGIPSIGARCGGIPEAATVILDDADIDVPGEFPPAEAVQAALQARHSPERCVNTFVNAIGLA